MQQQLIDRAYRPAGSFDSAHALSRYSGSWDQRHVAHLFRRAGFGASPATLADGHNRNMPEALAGMFRFDAAANLPQGPDTFVDPRSLFTGPAKDLTPEERKQVNMTYRADTIALQTWWLERMLATPAPLQEKMTLFWHGHFTSAIREKGTSPQAMLDQNWLFRRYAVGNIRELTRAVARNPAMLRYLDNARSAKSHPNENFARELMELFTLGIGNYSENDVRESARAFTGWGLDRDGAFKVFPNRHDDGDKTFLGHTGNFDGDDIIAIIFKQPACSRYFAKKIIEFFVYENPEPEFVDAVAAQLRAHDFELAPVLATLLASDVFYSPRAYRALVKSPVEFVLGSMKILGLTQVNTVALGALRKTGQTLFYPPNVKGWDGGAAWINSQTLLTRDNLINVLVNDPSLRTGDSLYSQIPTDPNVAAQRIVDVVLQGDCSHASFARLVQYLNGDAVAENRTLSFENFEERVRGGFYLAMAMPAFQLN